MRSWWSLCRGLCLELGSRCGVMGYDGDVLKKRGIGSGVEMVCFQAVLMFISSFSVHFGSWDC